MSWDWRQVWWQHHGTPGQARVFVAQKDGITRAILPLMLQRSTTPLPGLRLLRFIGGRLADYHGPLVDEDAEGALLAIFLTMKAATDWDLLDLESLPDGAFEKIRDAGAGAGLYNAEWPMEGCRYLDLAPSFDEYRASLSRNTRRELTKKRARLRELGAVTLRVETRAEEIAGIWEPIVQLSTRRWRAVGRETSLFESPRANRFVQDFVATLAPQGEIVVFLLELDGTAIAYHLCHLCHGVLSSWNAGWDPGHAALSPGRLLEEDLIHWAHDRELQAVDFMRGDYRYKSSWTPDVRVNRRLIQGRSRNLVRLTEAYHVRLRPLLRQRLGWLAQRTAGWRKRNVS